MFSHRKGINVACHSLRFLILRRKISNKNHLSISVNYKSRNFFDIHICHFDSLKIFSVLMSSGWETSTKCDCINHFRRLRNIVRKLEEAGECRVSKQLSIRLRCRHSIFRSQVKIVSFSIPWLGNLVSDIDNQFSIAGIQFSILVLPRNNFERFLKL